MELLGLTDYCIQPRQGGYRAIRYAPIIAFESDSAPNVAATDGRLLYMPRLRVGYTWLTLPTMFSGERGFDTTLTPTKQGSIEEQTLTGILPPMTPSVAQELGRMVELKYFIAVLLDPRGFWWMLGSIDCPCVFSYDFDGGKTLAAGSKIKVQFRAKNTATIVGLPSSFS